MLPPSPQKTLDLSYQPDLTKKRWTTTMSVSGGVGVFQYREDTKGRLYSLANPFAPDLSAGV